jgi:hypothetical protein
MISAESKKRIVNKFTEDVENIAEEVRGRIKLYSYFEAGAYDVVREGIHDIKKIIERQIPEEVKIDAVSAHVSFTGNTISVVMKNKFEESKVTFRERIQMVVRAGVTDDSIYNDCITGMFDVYQRLIEDALMRPNIEEFNNVLDELTKGADLDYKVSVVSPFMYGDKKIAILTDDEVVFVCDPDRIFELNTIAVMQVPVEVEEGQDAEEAELRAGGLTKESIDKVKKDVSDQFATAQTTAEFVENKGFALIQYVCDISNLKKPITYMKKIANKNILNNKVAYDGLYFYFKDNVFSLIKAKDGETEVVFSPIDITTFKRVEGVDVAGAFKTA